jgi:hypothetical protein
MIGEERAQAHYGPDRNAAADRGQEGQGSRSRAAGRGDGKGRVGVLCVPTKRLTLQSLLTVLTLLGAVTLVSARVDAEEIDFGQINKFESIATGTLHVGKPPKIIVDDGERHVVILTIMTRPLIEDYTSGPMLIMARDA